MTQYSNGGLLFFSKQKKHPQAPDYYGTIKFDKAFLLQKINEAVGAEVEIKLDSWAKTDKNGNPMFSLQVNSFVPQPQPAYRPPAPIDDSQIPF